jgi:hypothetical protein
VSTIDQDMTGSWPVTAAPCSSTTNCLRVERDGGRLGLWSSRRPDGQAWLDADEVPAHPHRITEAYGPPQPDGMRRLLGMVVVAPPFRWSRWLTPAEVRAYAVGLLAASADAEARARTVTEEEASHD